MCKLGEKQPFTLFLYVWFVFDLSEGHGRKLHNTYCLVETGIWVFFLIDRSLNVVL